MKIALVSEWLDAWRGGAETSTFQFLHHLIAHGVEVHVFTRSRPSSAPGLHIHTVGGASMSRIRCSVTFSHRVERLIRSESFDLVHAITPCRGADVYQPRGGTVAETIERNILLRSSGVGRSLKRYAGRFNLKQRYMLRLERQLLTARDGPVVIALSEYVITQLRKHYGLPDARIRKVFNGVDPPTLDSGLQARQRAQVRQEFGIQDHETLVLDVAHNFKLKGVRQWMEALKLLLSRKVTDVRSLVIGKEDSGVWRRLATKEGLSAHLTFVGPSSRMEEFFQAGDALVHPTYYDPCSRVVLEAMVHGLPCITTRWDGASEMIEDGKNGFVLNEPTDIDVLADRVTELREAQFRRRMGEAAKLITDCVSMARHTEVIVNLYRSLIDGRTPAGASA